MESSFEIRGNNNNFDFPSILNACIYQSLNLYNSKTKHLREERNIISDFRTRLYVSTACSVKIVRIFLTMHLFSCMFWYLGNHVKQRRFCSSSNHQDLMIINGKLPLICDSTPKTFWTHHSHTKSISLK